MRDRFAAAFASVGDRHKGRRIGTIWRNVSEETGDVTLTVEFLDLDALTRADVLQDAIGVLEREYALAVSLIGRDNG